MPNAQIAIVDDEPAIGALLCTAFADIGIEAESFTDGRDLVAALDTKQYDLFLIDLMMPGIDGLELLKALKERGAVQRLAVMSGCPESARATAASIAQTQGFEVVRTFAKPFDVDALVNALAEALVLRPLDGGAIRTAIEAGEMVVHYQPVFAAGRQSGAPLAYVEALVRWRHPRRGLLMPGDFLPLLDRPEDWKRLTVSVLSEVAAQLAAWDRDGFTTSVAVNLPPQILFDTGLPRTFGEILKAQNISPERVIFEITEVGELSFTEEERTVLTRLKINGYRLSLDDFGTGHSSLRRLYDLPFDQIKIDVGFVTKVSSDPRARLIVQTSVDLARALGLSICAEGIEDVEALQAMRECGCDHVQGYGLCRPAAAPMIELQYNTCRRPPLGHAMAHAPA